MVNNRLLVGFILIAIITGSNAYNNQENYSGTTEYNNYGVSFRYPTNAMIWETGHPDHGSPATDFSGRFSATKVSGGEFIEQVLVIWTVVRNVQTNDTVEDGLWDVLDDIRMDSNITLENFSETKTLAIDGFELVYIYFEGTQMGGKFNSIIGVMIIPWESLRSHRGYILGYVGSDGVFSEAELEEKFLEFLGSFEPVNLSP